MTIAPPPPLFETKADDEDDRPAQRTGAMIALRPRQDHIDRLALVDGEPPEELHTTILYLGKAADYSYQTRDRIIQAMREVALRFRNVTGNGFGINVWNPSGDEPCVVLGVSGKEMADIYNGIVSALQGFDLLQVPEQHEPWVPHITLKYTQNFDDMDELADLTGEVVYDAIRVVFGGITDDIPLQASTTAGDGVAGVPSRYAEAKGIKNPQKCHYCANPATGYVLHSEGMAYIPYDEAHKKRATEAAERSTPDGSRDPSNVVRHGELPQKKTFHTRRMPVIEEKVVRHVRTAAGVRRFGQPIGSVIVGDGSKLQHLKEQQSEYEGFNKYDVNGRAIYTRKEGSRFVAYDAQDNVIGTTSTEEGLLKQLDAAGGKLGKSKAAGMPRDVPEGLTAAKSEYEGYDKFIQKHNGQAVWRDNATGKFYDKNDNEVDIAGSGKSKQQDDPGGLKRVQSEYQGYSKFMGQNGKPVWRDDATGKFYDADDNEVDVNDYNGEKVKANLGSKPRAKKPMTRAESRSTGTVEDQRGKRQDEVDEPKKPTAKDRAAERRTSNAKAKEAALQEERDRRAGKVTVPRREEPRYRAEYDRGWQDSARPGRDLEAADRRGDTDSQAYSDGWSDYSVGEPKYNLADTRDKEDADRLAKKPDASGRDVEKERATVRAARIAERLNQRASASVGRSADNDLSDDPDVRRTPKPKQITSSNSASDVRDRLVGSVNMREELYAALDKVEGEQTVASVIATIKKIAARQNDARNRRLLNLYADRLKEAKIFAMLVKQDPWLRAIVLETKLITPGGRVGTDATLASSPKRNWVENSGPGRLPKYIRIVANGIKGHSKSRRIALAVAAVKRWARGGGNVKPAVRAAAAKAVAEWEALKAAA